MLRKNSWTNCPYAKNKKKLITKGRTGYQYSMKGEVLSF